MNNPDLVELHRRATEAFGERVHAVGATAWAQPTPCPDWDVRALVQHVVGENRWTPPLLEGATLAEVGDRFDGDLLGDDAGASWDRSAKEATDAVRRDGALTATAHLSFGDVPGEVYVGQLVADLLVHGWDLA
ncbi:MAG: TIGR03086 family metal-binding protein, partial [Actinomycetota bacterium]|nr:TIGR03086 family metal-binding protein [Actinomycetota bacterium]